MSNKRKTNKIKMSKLRNLSSISSDNTLEYYYNAGNIPNQDLVKETVEYFENGSGSRMFKSLAFMNLLNKQYNFIVENIEHSDLILTTLKNLPLADEERHILFGILLKWFGGYPVSNMNEKYDLALKLIQNEFLAYEGATPEKEFCKANRENRNHLTKLGIAFTNAINGNINAKDILDAIPSKKSSVKAYMDFYQLFEDAYNAGSFGNLANHHVFLIERSRHEFQFTVWLQDHKELEYGNHSQFVSLLQESIFNEYLKEEAADTERLFFLNTFTADEGYRVFQENYSKLKSKFRVKRVATKQDCANSPLLREGDILEFDPPYNTSIEAFTLLTKNYAVAYFELEKHLFIEKYKVWNQHTVKAEINELQKFIDGAKKYTLSDACSIYGKWEGNKWEYVYLRLEGGFYENLEVNKYPLINSFGNEEARVYGKYFLFYDFLKMQSIALSPPEFKLEKPKTLSVRSRLDFTKDKLNVAVLELANLNGYEKPSVYLDELLDAVKLFDDFDFECTFFLNIHYLCNENASKFWSESHRKDITMWLKKSHIITDIFDKTWESTPFQKIDNRLTIKTYALMHVYLAKFGGQAITQQNKFELAKKYGYTSGEQLRNDYIHFQNDNNRIDLNTNNKRSANAHIERFEKILPLLKMANQSAYDSVQKDLEKIKKKYDQHF